MARAADGEVVEDRGGKTRASDLATQKRMMRVEKESERQRGGSSRIG